MDLFQQARNLWERTINHCKKHLTLITALDLAFGRWLELRIEEDDDFPSSSWRNGSWWINGVCVTFVELNVDILPKVLNPMTSECDGRCETNRLRWLQFGSEREPRKPVTLILPAAVLLLLSSSLLSAVVVVVVKKVMSPLAFYALETPSCHTSGYLNVLY